MMATRRSLYHTRKPLSDIEEHKRVQAFLAAIGEEYARARYELKHGPTANGHAGYGVLKEEVEEVWQEVKHPTMYENLFKECVQTAAMAMAMALELE